MEPALTWVKTYPSSTKINSWKLSANENLVTFAIEKDKTSNFFQFPLS